jgi:hypothetical protein
MEADMCDPISIAAGVTAAGGALYSARAAANEARATAAWQDRQAAVEYTKAAYDIKQDRRKTKALLGTQMAAFSAAGVDASSGTPLDVQLDTIEQQELGVQARRFARDENVGRLQYGADTNRTKAGNAMTAGFIDAASAGLGAYNVGMRNQSGTSMVPDAPIQLPGVSDPAFRRY